MSAALDLYLSEWARPQGIDVVCSRLETKNGVLTGRYDGGDCCGPEKATRIRARYDLTRYGQIFAYGDTVEDREMLRLANHSYYCWQAQAM